MARQRNQEERRAALIDATLAAGSHLGLRTLSLSAVAEEAGITRGAILYYYDDLDDLLREAHRAGLQRFSDERDAHIASLAEPRAQLAAAIERGLPTGPDDVLMRVLYEFDVLAGTSALHNELVQQLYRRQLATYHRVIAAGEASGDFAPTLSRDDLAMTLVALEDAYGLHIVAGNALMTVDKARRAMFAVADRLGCSIE
ncbi:TetR family transcriptional regulator [Lysinibacter sp. HNR]|uniref:TetR family transcriptional regulator n=1 Tax=Lysinibacter sp. HNR TaxID=3031408 RepID=UPI002435280A|nr:TetR family transcriptional regulator [Lysinibacter sp. HNR]WGD37777.1 TetR family transcriptional regulator [Lysinibacter sp. HNR]